MRVMRFLRGRPTPRESPDRTVLETIMLPYFHCVTEVHSVLFVGCDRCTRHYEGSYFEGKDYWTIDPAPAARRFAGRQHVVAPLEDLGRHFASGRFDLIICNGVFGYAPNRTKQCQQAFRECHAALREGGYLIVGWDDIPERTPVPMEDAVSLLAFERVEFPPLGTWRYLTDTPYRRTFDFYRRPMPKAPPTSSSDRRSH